MAFDPNAAFNYVVQACNDANIGYSMNSRSTITLGVNYKTYCDCSSLMAWACWKAGAWPNNPWFATSNEGEYLIKAGFTKHNANAVNWVAGAILTRNEQSTGTSGSGHTEMVYRPTGANMGYTMGAHTSHPSSGLFADQVSINSYVSYASNWDYIYIPPTPVGQTYEWTQRNVNTYGALTTDEIYANAVLTYSELVNIGFSDAAAAGVLGNIEHEGQFNPAQWQGGYAVGSWYEQYCGYGMFQYTPPHKYYQDWAANFSGFNINDASINGPYQVRWLDAHPGQFTGSGPYMQGTQWYGMTWAQFKTMTNAADAAEVWARAWERPGEQYLISTMPARRSSAEYWYNEIINNFPHLPGNPGWPDIPNNPGNPDEVKTRKKYKWVLWNRNRIGV